MQNRNPINQVSKSLVILRRKHNLSQREFAEQIGVTRTMVAGYESLNREPRLDTLLRISAAYGVSVDDILKGNV